MNHNNWYGIFLEKFHEDYVRNMSNLSGDVKIKYVDRISLPCEDWRDVIGSSLYKGNALEDE